MHPTCKSVRVGEKRINTGTKLLPLGPSPAHTPLHPWVQLERRQQRAKTASAFRCTFTSAPVVTCAAPYSSTRLPIRLESRTNRLQLLEILRIHPQQGLRLQATQTRLADRPRHMLKSRG